MGTVRLTEGESGKGCPKHHSISTISLTRVKDGVFPSLGGAMQSEAVDIYHSTDGGETWIKVASTNDIGSGLPFAGFKRNITFLNSTTGWITREFEGNFEPNLYVTHDGGRTWRQQGLPTPSNARSVVQYSPSGWRYVYSPKFVPWPPKFFTAQDGIVRFDYQNPDNQSFVVFYATHNGGATWTPTRPVPVTEAYPLTSHFVSMNRGWFKHADALNMTDDGGNNWTPVRVDPLLKGVTQLDFISPELGWAVRDSGSSGGQGPPMLLRTLDAGRTWVPVPYTIVGQ